MIGSLRGTVIDREVGIDGAAASEVLIEVGGIGYRVLVTASTLDRLGGSDPVLVYTHHHIREADQKLYGFLSREERAAFEGLLAAHGVGPALAMAVLATHSATGLARILADDDLAALCEVPGVGKKTAQRLLVELKSTLVLPELDPLPTGANGSGAGVAAAATPLDDVRHALANLGYSGDEIRRALAGVPEPHDDPGLLLKLALRALAGA